MVSGKQLLSKGNLSEEFKHSLPLRFQANQKIKSPSDENEKKATLSLSVLYKELQAKQNQSFSQLSYINNASLLIPLSTIEMHHTTGALIASATHEVIMQFYKFHMDSDAARIILDALRFLKDKATNSRQKITVNILVNSRGILGELFYKKNEDTGLEEIAKQLNNAYFQINLILHRTAMFGSFHSKFIVVDGCRAMIRGTDIGRNDNFHYNRHESAILVDNPLSELLRQDFVESWNQACPTSLRMDIKQTENKKVSHQHLKQFEPIPCILLSKREIESPCSTLYSPYKIAVLKAIACAQSTIKIITANLNDTEICSALADACNRGIQVKIIMGKFHNDDSEKKWGGTNADSMANMVRQINRPQLHNATIKWATDEKNELVTFQEKNAIHTKYVCIDDEIIFTGSSPLDKQAMNHSRELDIVFESKEKALEFNAKYFNAKFIRGKDFFDDAYDRLHDLIIQQIKSTQDSKSASPIARMIASRIKVLLGGIDSNDVDLNPLKKSIHLITSLLSILETGVHFSCQFAINFRRLIMRESVKYGILEQDLIPDSAIELSSVKSWKCNL